MKIPAIIAVIVALWALAFLALGVKVATAQQPAPVTIGTVVGPPVVSLPGSSPALVRVCWRPWMAPSWFRRCVVRPVTRDGHARFGSGGAR